MFRDIIEGFTVCCSFNTYEGLEPSVLFLDTFEGLGLKMLFFKHI